MELINTEKQLNEGKLVEPILEHTLSSNKVVDQPSAHSRFSLIPTSDHV